MPEITRSSGLRITFPDTYSVSTGAIDLASSPPIAKRRLQSELGMQQLDPTTMSSGEFPLESAAILQALEKQEMQLVDAVELDPKLESTPMTGRRRRGAPSVPEKQSATLEIDVQPSEDAAVLLEQDGVYSWVFPTKHTGADIDLRGTRRGHKTEEGRRLIFSIDVYATSTRERRQDRRGLFTDLIYSKVKVLVLKFAARIFVGHAMPLLERNVSRGIVIINSEDPNQWQHVDDISAVSLPPDRMARVLLLLHGTFSSTAGSFGELGGTPWGREFIRALLSNYDIVIGFNHPTLSEDPLTNAVDLLRRLQGRSWTHAPHIDSIAFSRGALVLRSLIEHLLPTADWPGRFERVVFVGSTNGGTALAEPDNWYALIDLYTNLAAGATRVLSLMPQAAVPMKILSEALQGLGALVKYMATEAVTKDGVPGLAAMEPDGNFIKNINQTQPGQPTPEKTCYYAVTSAFKARVLDGDHEPKELPRRLVLALADKFVDQLMKNAPNDLVVDTPSMTKIDPHAGQYVRDTLNLGATSQVYHLNYFIRPEVINALTRWLQLAAPTAESGPLKTNTQKRAGLELEPLQNLTLGRITWGEIPAAVNTDILVTDIKTPVNEAIVEFETKAPSYVVVQDLVSDPSRWNFSYAMPTEKLLNKLDAHRDETRSLGDMVEWSKENWAETLSISSVRSGRTRSSVGELGIVVTDDQPVGIISKKRELLDSANLVETAKHILQPNKPKDFILAREVMPTFNPVPLGYGVGQGSDHVPQAQCHFRAEMEEEVKLNRATTIEVTVSREVIGEITHAAAAEGAAAVRVDRKLVIQVIPKRNFEVVGEEDRIEIEPLEEEKPQQFFFDVRATHDDRGEGELWVIARQGQVPLVQLTLRPRIVAKLSKGMRRVATEAKSMEAPPLSEPLTQLFITEQINGGDLRYYYQLQSPKLDLLKWDVSKPIKGSREQYVKKLYDTIEERWVSSQNDVEDFYEELRAYGAELYNELVPEKIQEALWQHRDKIDNIMVIAEEPFIPWEVVHIVEPGKPLGKGTRFLGELGLVRWLHKAGWPKETISIEKGRAYYLIPSPDDLPETLKEAKYLQETFDAQAVEPTSAAVRKLLSTPDAFDLLHFAGHGEAENDNNVNATLLLQGRVENGRYIKDKFNATTAMYQSNLQREGKAGPMIVLNACQVGQASYKLTGTGGFAEAFLSRGASVFVGALWSIGDAPARTFTEEFYTQLKDRKANIAEATKSARAKAKTGGEATWLAYVVYGHPLAQLT